MDHSGKGKRLGIIIAGIAAVLLIACFGIICAVANSSKNIFPHTYVGNISISGLREADAASLIEQKTADQSAQRNIVIQCPDFQVTMDAAKAEIGINSAETAKKAYELGREGNALQKGLAYLSALFHKRVVSVDYTLGNETYVKTLLNDAVSQISDPLVETSYKTEGKNLVITVGREGNAVDESALYKTILNRLTVQDFSVLVVKPQVKNPSAIDWDALYQSVYVAPSDASLDSKTGKIIPHITGVNFDLEAAKKAVESASAGQTVTIPLVYTQPGVTTKSLNAELFKNVLGTCTTTVGGSSNRASNVKLSASLVNGTILNPGDVFSYNTTVGSRQASRGFLPAPAYVSGQTVDEIGGGVCQVSSTLYLASLRSNLQIMERYCHTYAVGYVPDGMDATVYYGSLDYRFKNNTKYPIKISASMSGRTLRVVIYGTDTDHITVKMTNKTLSTSPYKTVLKEDSSLSSGQQKVETTGYTGKTVEVYRSVYGSDGTLISSKLENTSVYKKRDKIILVASKTGHAPPPSPSPSKAPATATPKPSVSPSPSPSPKPSASAPASPGAGSD